MTAQKKSMKKRTQKNIRGKTYIKEKNRDRIYELIPLLLTAGLVPLIVFIKKVTFSDAGNMFQDGSEGYFDVFSYYKMAVLLISAALGTIIFLFSRDSGDLKRTVRASEMKRYYIPMGVYVLFVILSSALSEYKTVALWGYRERFEGVFVLISYMVVMFLAANVIREEKSIKILFACLLASAFIISLLGTLQLLGLDYFKSKFIQSLIVPLSLKAKKANFSSNFPPKTVFATLYNPNYVGSYMAIIIPVLVVFLARIQTFAAAAKKNICRLVLAVILCLAAAGAVGCESSAGLVGIAFSVIIILIMFRRSLLQHKKIIIAALVILCGGLAAFNFAGHGIVVNKIKQAAVSFVNGNTGSESRKALDKALQGLEDVSLSSERAKIVTEKGTLQITLKESKLVLTDENNKSLDYSYKDDKVDLTDARFNSFDIDVEADKGFFGVNYNSQRLIDIYLTKNGLYSTSNRWLLTRDDKNVEAFGFKGLEAMGTNRGYIWSRTIPLLKNTVLAGFGPDNFPMHFPQYDYLNKLRFYETGGIYVDKPHNMYLQIAVNTGIISLLAVLAIFIMYFVSSIRLYIKEKFESFLPVAGLACFAAFCGYAVTGFFNDSVVSVAPVFWTLLGLGISINVKLSAEKKSAGEKKA